MFIYLARKLGSLFVRFGRLLRGDGPPLDTVESDVVIELTPGYTWDCDSCGRENYQRCISVVLDNNKPSHAKVIRHEYDIPEDKPIPEWLHVRTSSNPSGVVCKFCNTWFACMPQQGPGEDPEEVDEVNE
jgi:hypothetical protein